MSWDPYTLIGQDSFINFDVKLIPTSLKLELNLAGVSVNNTYPVT